LLATFGLTQKARCLGLGGGDGGGHLEE